MIWRFRNLIFSARCWISLALDCQSIFRLPPLGFLESLYLWKDAALVITGSGGLQEETTALGIPCLTLRENTERPVTVAEGTNRLVKIEELAEKVAEVLAGKGKRGKVPELWDRRAVERIVEVLIGKIRLE